MKNRVIYILVLLLFVGIFGCDKDESEDISIVTEFAVITLNGDNPMFLNVGETYTELGGQTNTGDEITITGSVDTNTPGVYTVNYSATNQDGFKNTVSRTVYVSNTGDLVNSLEGLYTCSVTRTNDPAETYTDLQFIRIWKVGDGVFQISHAMGAFYEMGRGYSDNYAFKGCTITVNDMAANDFTITGGAAPGWPNDPPVTIIDFKVDQANKTITYTVNWLKYVLNVTLVQYQF